MYHYWFISFVNKHTTLMQVLIIGEMHVNNRGSCVFQGLWGREKGKRVYENFVVSAQFLSKPKAAF